MFANDTVFLNPPVALSVLQTAIADYDAKLAAKASRDSQAIVDFNVSRDTI